MRVLEPGSGQGSVGRFIICQFLDHFDLSTGMGKDVHEIEYDGRHVSLRNGTLTEAHYDKKQGSIEYGDPQRLGVEIIMQEDIDTSNVYKLRKIK